MSTASFALIPGSVQIIRFQDRDPFNHLNKGRYVDYLLHAREDHLLEHYELYIHPIARERAVLGGEH